MAAGCGRGHAGVVGRILGAIERASECTTRERTTNDLS
jgi:hypothetical protein